MNLSSFERLAEVIKHLGNQATQIDKQNASNKAHKLLAEDAIFSDDLFSTYSDKFYAYVKEIEQKFNQLRGLIKANQSELAHSQLPLIEQQITALLNAFNANNSLHNAAQYRLDSFKKKRYRKAAQQIMATSHELHQKLAEHREFERRLADMITDRERQRTNNYQSNAQQKLAQEVLTLHERIGRCRQAISKIEHQIEMAEKRSS